MTEELKVTQEDMKSCPFCGTKDHVFLELEDTTWNQFWGGCDADGGCGVVFGGDSEDKVISVWNNRPEPQGELVEALKGLVMAVEVRSLRGWKHVPSMRDMQTAWGKAWSLLVRIGAVEVK